MHPSLRGVWGNKVYATPIYPIPAFKTGVVHWEMFNILLALRVWSNHWRHSIVKFHCDNLAVVQVVQTSKTKDPFLGACIHNIWMITAIFDIEIQIWIILKVSTMSLLTFFLGYIQIEHFRHKLCKILRKIFSGSRFPYHTFTLICLYNFRSHFLLGHTLELSLAGHPQSLQTIYSICSQDTF